MNRKNSRLSRQLDQGSLALDDPQLIIRAELKNYIARKQFVRKRILVYVSRGLAGLLIIILAYFYMPRIIASITFGVRYIFTFSMVNVVQKNVNVIKSSALSQLPQVSFKEYEFADNQPHSDLARYAALIYRYNNDFYGKVNHLTKQYEQRLLAYISQNKFNKDDLCNLDRPLHDDTLRTLRNFILSKVYSDEQSSDYFNPIIDELNQTVLLYQQQLDEALYRPLSKETVKALRRQSVINKLDISQADPIIDVAINYCVANPVAINEVVYYNRKIREIQLEQDIRLGLLYLAIGKDYNVRGDSQNFGWLKAGYKGKTFIKDRKAPQKYGEFFNQLQTELKDFNTVLKQVRFVYNNTKLDEWHLRIGNPLRIGLKVKDVGLYGARRKTAEGGYYEHRGIDLIAEEGTSVYPVQDGFVTNVEKNTRNGGNVIEIWHDSNITSVYAHLASGELWRQMQNRFDSEGPFWIGKDEAIANIGMTGNIPEDSDQYGYAHLHLEIREYNRYKNPFLLFNQQILVIHD